MCFHLDEELKKTQQPLDGDRSKDPCAKPPLLMLHEFVSGCTVVCQWRQLGSVSSHHTHAPVILKTWIIYRDYQGCFWHSIQISSCFPAECWRPCCCWPTHELIGWEQWWRAQLLGVLAADWASRKQAWGVQPIERPQILCYSSTCVTDLSVCHTVRKKMGKLPNGKHPKVCFSCNNAVFLSVVCFSFHPVLSPAAANLAHTLSQNTTEQFQQYENQSRLFLTAHTYALTAACAHRSARVL